MSQFELWIGQVHRPLDAKTPAQALARGRQFARRYRTPNVRTVAVMQLDAGQAPQCLATWDPWADAAGPRDGSDAGTEPDAATR
jgi:hypothetical protein